MKNFFKTNGIRAAAILLTLLLVLIVAAAIWGGEGSPVGSAVRVLTSPVERLISAAGNELDNFTGYFREYELLKEENADMRSQIAEMDAEIRAARSSNSENDKLKALLGLMETEQDFEVKTISRVISRTASNWSSTLLIGGGALDGIETGDTVITEEGYLVGQVIEVGATTAEVRTLIDVDSSVGAIVDRNSLLGVASGDFELMRQGELRLGILPVGADLLNGDVVLTSGAGEVFPQGLIIGNVTAYVIDDSGMNWHGNVKPSALLDSLTEVFVVR
jgi:rod shape-determining protein MreC